MPSAAAAAAAASSPPPAAYVYSGPGAGTRSVLSTLHSLREALVPSVKVTTLDTAELLAGGWQPGCLLLVMPGGADLPYCKHLNGRGNQLIREYVEGGGSYLGLCAGAYYASARVEFEPGTRLEVVGDRELAFFPGAAVGCVYKGFHYESEAGAVAAPLRWRQVDGCPAGASETHVCDGAAGQQAQQADHAEQAQQARHQQVSDCEWEDCVDYVNGGPAFTRLDGSPLAPLLLGREAQQAQQTQKQQQQGGMRNSAQAAEQQELQQRPQQHDQAAGPLQQQGQFSGVELLAILPECGDAAAALRCWVGERGGRAVLCSSHPELHPCWLSGEAPPTNGGSSADASDNSSSNGSGRSSSNGSNGLRQAPAAAAPVAATAAAAASLEAANAGQGGFVDTLSNRAAAASALGAKLSGAEHVARLQAALASGEAQRRRFWWSLLAASGLDPFMLPENNEE